MFEETRHYEQKNLQMILKLCQMIIDVLLKNLIQLPKSIADETMYNAEQVQLKNYNLKQENQNLRHEVIQLKDLVNDFVHILNIEDR